MDDKIESSTSKITDTLETNMITGAEACSGQIDGIIDNLNKPTDYSLNSDFEAIFNDKRDELNRIQEALQELTRRLNNFIAEPQGDLLDGEDLPIEFDNEKIREEYTEKQDGPQEKELMLQTNGLVPAEMCIGDAENPPEIDWDTMAPFIKNVVGDLHKIRSLNQMTNSVLTRIRNITTTSDKCK